MDPRAGPRIWNHRNLSGLPAQSNRLPSRTESTRTRGSRIHPGLIIHFIDMVRANRTRETSRHLFLRDVWWKRYLASFRGGDFEIGWETWSERLAVDIS